MSAAREVMKSIVFFLVLISAGVVLADDSSRLAQLETALSEVRQEQQAVYQQFQMVQELRRNDMQIAFKTGAQSSAILGMQSLPSVNYDENAGQQRAQQDRIEQRSRDMNALYARYVELERQRKALFDQIIDLRTHAKDR